MPEDGGRSAKATALGPLDRNLNVARDAPDLRDDFYKPVLRPLPRVLKPTDLLKRIIRRDQGSEGSCTGQALATVIDILRAQDEPTPPPQVPWSSARMLMEMARQIEPQTSGTGAPTSLRPTLKAFYHYGVCGDLVWPYEDGIPCGGLSKERLDAARSCTLGAYYRVSPILNHFHAALNEAEAIFASATLHEGWSSKAVAAADGHIRVDGSLPIPSQGHAFAIVGYDKDGFLILNSWGEDWGGFEGEAGLAHWSYPDWAQNILDAWVIRLAVPTPDAFAFATGAQGIFGGLDIPIGAGSTPRSQVLGHYLHLDDGKLCKSGSYASSLDEMRDTVRILLERRKQEELKEREEPDKEHRRKYEHVLLWLAGATEGVKEAMADIARLKPAWVSQQIYPITILWCADFVESLADVMSGIFEAAKKQVPEADKAFDALIETRARGPGRAFLRDIKRASHESARGPLAKVLQELNRLQDRGFKVHIVTEGVGALLLSDLARLIGATGAPMLPALASVTMLAPAMTDTLFRELRTNLAPLGLPQVTVATAGPRQERQMRLGDYGGSVLRLVDRAFEDTRRGHLLGLHAVAERAEREEGALPVRHATIVWNKDVKRPGLNHLTRGEAAIGLVLDQITRQRAEML